MNSSKSSVTEPANSLPDESLFKKLEWRRATDRISAVNELGRYCTARSLEALLSLNDNDHGVRDAAAAALERLREHSSWDELLAAFKHGGEEVQVFVVALLGRNRDDSFPEVTTPDDFILAIVTASGDSAKPHYVRGPCRCSRLSHPTGRASPLP